MKFDISKFMAGLLLVLGFLAILILSSCDNKTATHNTGADGYHFETPQKVVTDLHVQIVLVPSTAEMNRLYEEHAGKKMPPGLELKAFSTLYPAATNLCTMYILDPQVARYEPEFIGHEFTHCVFGNWHLSQDEKRGQS